MSNKLMITFGLVAAVCACVGSTLAKKSDKQLYEDISKFDKCLIQAMFSFYYPESFPPTTQKELVEICQLQSDAFKCVREKTKGAEALIRRGAISLINTRSRQHRKLCSNPNSPHAQKFMAASKCVIDNKVAQLKEIDRNLGKHMAAIVQRNYNDSRPELKLLCCTLYDFKQGSIDVASEACPDHREMIGEIFDSIITDDVTIVCDDKDKLARNCPKLERLPIDKIQSKNLPPQAALSLYAFSTLGEPSETPPSFI